MLGYTALVALTVSAALAALAGQGLLSEGPFGYESDRISMRDWNLGAAFLTSHGKRDTILVIASLVFVVFSMFLWTLPIPQTQLFYISTPPGFGFLVAMIWWIGREKN